jgi:aryl-alcohol dehydrogenase-like predicted oxidoreductase
MDIERPDIGVLSTCRELGITILAYSPVGRGLLTGSVKSIDDLPEGDFRKNVPKYRDNFDGVLKLVETFKKVGEAHGCTSAQACLAWLLAQGEDIIPLPGTRTIKYLTENHEAALVKLTAEEVEGLRKQAEAAEWLGDRYPPDMMQAIFADTPAL